MTLQQKSVLVLQCDVCHQYAETFNEDIAVYDSSDQAREATTSSRGIWRWTDTTHTCPACLQKEREAACSHEWAFDMQNRSSGAREWVVFYECTRCGARDLVTSDRRMLAGETGTPLPEAR